MNKSPHLPASNSIANAPAISAIMMHNDQASAGMRRGKNDHPGTSGAELPGKPCCVRSLS